MLTSFSHELLHTSFLHGLFTRTLYTGFAHGLLYTSFCTHELVPVNCPMYQLVQTRLISWPFLDSLAQPPPLGATINRSAKLDVRKGCAGNTLRTKCTAHWFLNILTCFYMILHALGGFYMFLHVFTCIGMFWAKKWSPDFWSIFQTCSRIVSQVS